MYFVRSILLLTILIELYMEIKKIHNFTDTLGTELIDIKFKHRKILLYIKKDSAFTLLLFL